MSDWLFALCTTGAVGSRLDGRVLSRGIHLDAAGIAKVVKDETASILAVLSCEQLGAAVAHAEALAAKFQSQGSLPVRG